MKTPYLLAVLLVATALPACEEKNAENTASSASKASAAPKDKTPKEAAPARSAAASSGPAAPGGKREATAELLDGPTEIVPIPALNLQIEAPKGMKVDKVDADRANRYAHLEIDD